jgi:hypothetical protein
VVFQDFAIPVSHLISVMNPRLAINREDVAKIQIKSENSKFLEEKLLFL